MNFSFHLLSDFLLKSLEFFLTLLVILIADLFVLLDRPLNLRYLLLYRAIQRYLLLELLHSLSNMFVGFAELFFDVSHAAIELFHTSDFSSLKICLFRLTSGTYIDVVDLFRDAGDTFRVWAIALVET